MLQLGKGQCLRALYFREELVLCLDHSVQIPNSQHYLFQAILCCMHLPYKQQIRQWPACMSSQASTLIVDVSLRHMQHLWLASTDSATRVAKSCELCTITSLFLLILPSDNRLCTPINTVDDTFSLGCGKVFPRNSAIDLLGHIVPLVHEL